MSFLLRLLDSLSELFKSKYQKLAQARFKSIMRGETPPKLCFSCGAQMLNLRRDKFFNRKDYYLCPKCGARQDICGIIREIHRPFTDEPAEAEKEPGPETGQYNIRQIGSESGETQT